MQLPQSYTQSKVKQLIGFPVHSRNQINGCCPVCREGKSWGKKKRFFYYTDKDFMFCFNCSRSWTPYWFIKEVTGMTFAQIKEDVGEDLEDNYQLQVNQDFRENSFILPDLPGECINLREQSQIEYFKKYSIIQTALNYCKKRRLFSAINTPKTFFVCLKDRYHQDRLIIPFYGNNHKIESYTSRKLNDFDVGPKYLLKFNSDKPLFNIDKIDVNFPFIFLFEGQIDAMFVKNGVAVSGLTLTDKQEEQLSQFIFHKRIWVIDNLLTEHESVRKKVIEKFKDGDTIFLFKDEFSKFKDLNEYCTEKGLDSVDPDLLLKYSFTGEKGIFNIV